MRQCHPGVAATTLSDVEDALVRGTETAGRAIGGVLLEADLVGQGVDGVGDIRASGRGVDNVDRAVGSDSDRPALVARVAVTAGGGGRVRPTRCGALENEDARTWSQHAVGRDDHVDSLPRVEGARRERCDRLDCIGDLVARSAWPARVRASGTAADEHRRGRDTENRGGNNGDDDPGGSSYKHLGDSLWTSVEVR